MAVKIDLEKTYNRLKWGFEHDTLEDIKVLHEFIDLVWHCYSSLLMRVLWNGEALNPFSHPMGFLKEIHSPYIFLCCVLSVYPKSYMLRLITVFGSQSNCSGMDQTCLTYVLLIT